MDSHISSHQSPDIETKLRHSESWDQSVPFVLDISSGHPVQQFPKFIRPFIFTRFALVNHSQDLLQTWRQMGGRSIVVTGFHSPLHTALSHCEFDG